MFYNPIIQPPHFSAYYGHSLPEPCQVLNPARVGRKVGRFVFRGNNMIYDGWLYLAKSNTGHYKIGRSQNPFTRIKHFDTIMPVEVQMIGAFPCDNVKRAEADYHRWCKNFRVKGEWFDFSEEFAKLIIRGFTVSIAYINGKLITRMKDEDFYTCCFDVLTNASIKGEFVSSNDLSVVINVETEEEYEQVIAYREEFYLQRATRGNGRRGDDR